jgi:predicted transcriptional regulator of viral defense system
MATNTITKLLNAESPFLSVSSLQALFNITRESARTAATRLVKSGILVRLQRDLYTLANRKYSNFALANALHQPSVISLESALNYWGLIVQVPQTVFSISQRSYRCIANDTEFVYRRMNSDLFRFGQTKAEDFFIVEPEKALLDTLYIISKGLAELLPEDVDMSKLDGDLLAFYCSSYPKIVSKLLSDFERHEYEAK